jgi:hypothetical protein
MSTATIQASEPREDRATSAAETFRWNLKAGQKFKVQLEQKMTQVIDMGIGEQEMPMSFTMHMSWTVDEATENEFKVTQIVDRVTMNMSLPGMGDVEYDSASDKKPEGMASQFATVLKPLVGLKILQTLNGRGQSVKCEIDPEALKGLTSAGMGGQFASEETLKNLIGQTACVFPEEAVEKGGTWEDQFAVNNQMGKMTTNAKFTYDGPEQVDGKQMEKISVVSTISVEASEDAPVEVDITKQDNKGTVYFDNNAGYIAKAVGTQAMSMTVVTQGTEITVVSNGTVTFTVTPDDGTTPPPESSEEKSGG